MAVNGDSVGESITEAFMRNKVVSSEQALGSSLLTKHRSGGCISLALKSKACPRT